jgi:sulfur carrier protein ThiS
MKITVEDLILHETRDVDVPSGTDVAGLIKQLDYDRYDLFHVVQGKHARYDQVLNEGDNVVIIPVPGGG